ncbi:hypothetical protein JW960_05825 [candidate division KSB1 bacterium]|nr:hypothetical protein [candidate division KSB1 bacterium]
MKLYMLGVICLFLVIILPESVVHAQYSQAEINLAIQRLQERGFLDSFVNKTADDPKQVAIRADILLASYHILRELDKIKTRPASPVDNDLQPLRLAVNNLTSRLDQMETNDQTVMNNPKMLTHIFNEVDTYLSNSLALRGVQKSVQSLEQQNTDLEGKIRAVESKFDKLAINGNHNMEKKVRTSQILAGTSLVLTLITSLLAAR